MGVEKRTVKTYEQAKRHKQVRRNKEKRNAKRQALFQDFENWMWWYKALLVDLIETIEWLMKNLPWEQIQELSEVIHKVSVYRYHLWLIQTNNEDAIYDLYREQIRKRPN